LAEEMIAELAGTSHAARSAGLAVLAEAAAEASVALARATAWARAQGDATPALLATASPFLRLFATGLAMGFMTEAAIVADQRCRAGEGSTACRHALADALYFAGNEAALLPGMVRAVMAGLPDPEFGA
jgi:hypothetical protein